MKACLREKTNVVVAAASLMPGPQTPVGLFGSALAGFASAGSGVETVEGEVSGYEYSPSGRHVHGFHLDGGGFFGGVRTSMFHRGGRLRSCRGRRLRRGERRVPPEPLRRRRDPRDEHHRPPREGLSEPRIPSKCPLPHPAIPASSPPRKAKETKAGWLHSPSADSNFRGGARRRVRWSPGRVKKMSSRVGRLEFPKVGAERSGRRPIECRTWFGDIQSHTARRFDWYHGGGGKESIER
ncbi:hypothetical protein BH20ACT10_BH20ACT10_03810 [soil metagenome]